MRILGTARRRVFVLVVSTVVLTVGAPSLLLLDGRSPKERATAWVTVHASSLPTTVEEFVAYPTQYRKAIWAALSEEVKADLWRAQMDRLLGEPSLTEKQRATVIQLRGFIKPEYYRAGAKLPPALTEMCAKKSPTVAVLGTFTSWLSDLGVQARPKSTVRTLALHAYESVSAKVNAMAGRTQSDCQCNVGSLCSCNLWPNPVFWECQSADCTYYSTGCGCYWLWACNGECNLILPG